MSHVYYAIGDIHGELEKLKALHSHISDFHDAMYPGQNHTRIHLGDYVDRGPNSSGVIDYIKCLEGDELFNVVNLKGNHEILMLRAHRSAEKRALSHWLQNGGEQTAQSYEGPEGQDRLSLHLDWIESLPTIFKDETRRLIFVHAGIDPQNYPQHDDKVHLWTRNGSFFESEHWDNTALDGATVIHGHTPTASDYPDVSKDGRRINVDTGACYGGPLSAVVLAVGDKTRFLVTD